VFAKIDFTAFYPIAVASDRSTLACFRYVSGIKLRRIQLEGVTDLSADLQDAPLSVQLWVNGAFNDISSLENLSASLQDVTIWSTEQISDLSVFERLPLLRELRVGLSPLTDISFLEGLPELTTLWLPRLESITDLGILQRLVNLRSLRLGSSSKLPSLEF